MNDHVVETVGKTCNLGRLGKNATFTFEKNNREPYRILSNRGNTVEAFNVNSGNRRSFSKEALVIPIWLTVCMDFDNEDHPALSD